MALHPDTFDIGPRKGTRRGLSTFSRAGQRVRPTLMRVHALVAPPRQGGKLARIRELGQSRPHRSDCAPRSPRSRAGRTRWPAREKVA